MHSYTQDIQDNKIKWHISLSGVSFVDSKTGELVLDPSATINYRTSLILKAGDKTADENTFLETYKLLEENISYLKELSDFKSTPTEDDYEGLEPDLSDYNNLLKQELQKLKNSTEIGGPFSSFTPQMRYMVGQSKDKKKYLLSNLNKATIDDPNFKIDFSAKEVVRAKNINSGIKFSEINTSAALSENVHVSLLTSNFLNNPIDILSIIPKFLFNGVGDYPLPIQFFICDKNTADFNIDALFNNIKSITSPEQVRFVIMNIHYLKFSVFKHFDSRFKEYEKNPIPNRRIYLINFKETTPASNLLGNVNNLSNFKFEKAAVVNFYTKFFSDSFKSYVVYSKQPETGKTQMILKRIYEENKGRDYYYHRYIVDNGTTLQMLIDFLNSVKFDKDKKTYIHFNVDGNINLQFTFYLLQLVYFNVLTDNTSRCFTLYDLPSVPEVYFEIGTKTHVDFDEMKTIFFPLAQFMEKVDVGQPLDIFSLDEYVLETVNKLSKIRLLIKSRRYLPNAAAIVYMSTFAKAKDGEKLQYINLSKNTISEVTKSKENYNILDKIPSSYEYNDFKESFDSHVRFFEENPKIIYSYFKSVLYKGKEQIISIINNVSKIINSNRGPFISKSSYKKQREYNQQLTIMIGENIVNSAMFNCGKSYEATDDDKVDDTRRLEQIKEFQKTIPSIIVTTNFAAPIEQQSYFLIAQNKDKKVFDILNEYGIQVSDKMSDFLSTFYDYDKFKNLRNNSHGLFQSFASVFGLQINDEIPYNKLLFIKIWDDIKNSDALDQFLGKDFITKIMTNDRDLNTNYSKDENINDFLKNLKEMDLKDMIFDKKNKLNVEKLYENFSAEIAQNYDHSNIKSIAITPQSINRCSIIISRCMSNLPIILMGETGVGKTYIINILKQIIARHVKLEKTVIHAGTTRGDLIDFIKPKIEKCNKERGKIRGTMIFNLIKQKAKSDKLRTDFMQWFVKQKNIKEKDEFTNEEITNFAIEKMHELVQKFIEDEVFASDKKSSYFITDNTQIANVINHLHWKLDQFNDDVEANSPQLLFFFDEVNAAAIQWFIKELIVDRYFLDERLPNYVRFIAAVNPLKKIPQNIADRINKIGLTIQETNDQLKDFIYKVQKMPESYIPFILPFDPERLDKNDTECYKILECSSEFELFMQQIMDRRLLDKPRAIDLERQDMHFSQSEDFAEDYSTNAKAQEMLKIVKILNFSSARLVVNPDFYGDESFISLRDPERCSTIIRWFHKSGILSADAPKDFDNKFRYSLVLALSVVYWFKLNEKMREDYINKIIEVWRSIGSKQFPSPTADEWKKWIEQEISTAADIFCTEKGISKNKPLKENCWATYVALINRIPLWIIGAPGLSKSLSVNMAINGLRNGYIKLPNGHNFNILKQLFMCSKESTTKDLSFAFQLLANEDNRIIQNIKNTKNSKELPIPIMMLEEMGHADLSDESCLKLLHQVIDEGVTAKDKTLQISIVGLSNYKMDSAKLNRGLLILRDNLLQAEMANTLKNIFNDVKKDNFKQEITQSEENILKAIAKAKNTSSAGEIYSIRDLYAFAQNLAQISLQKEEEVQRAIFKNLFCTKIEFETLKQTFPTRIYQAFNFNNSDNKPIVCEDYKKLIFDSINANVNFNLITNRHLMFITEDDAALDIITEELGDKKDSVVLFGNRQSGISESIWVAEDCERFLRAMSRGNLVIIHGIHPCFNNLYDIFNQKYQEIVENKQTKHIGFISCNGGSYSAEVKPEFRCVIVLTKTEFDQLPAPFVSRFEKHYLNYNTESFAKILPKIENFAKTTPFVNESITSSYLSKQYMESVCALIGEKELTRVVSENTYLLAYLPASIYFYRTMLNAEEEPQKGLPPYSETDEDDDMKKEYNTKRLFKKYSYLHTSVMSLIKNYENLDDEENPFNFIFGSQRKSGLKGISSVVVVPGIHPFDKDSLKDNYDIYEFPIEQTFDFDKVFNDFVSKISEKEEIPKVMVFTANKPNEVAHRLPQLKFKINEFRKEHESKNIILHTFICLNVLENHDKIHLLQSKTWPVLGLDFLPNKLYGTSLVDVTIDAFMRQSQSMKKVSFFSKQIFKQSTALYQKLLNEDEMIDVDDSSTENQLELLAGKALKSKNSWRQCPKSLFNIIFTFYRRFTNIIVNTQYVLKNSGENSVIFIRTSFLRELNNIISYNNHDFADITNELIYWSAKKIISSGRYALEDGVDGLVEYLNFEVPEELDYSVLLYTLHPSNDIPKKDYQRIWDTTIKPIIDVEQVDQLLEYHKFNVFVDLVISHHTFVKNQITKEFDIENIDESLKTLISDYTKEICQSVCSETRKYAEHYQYFNTIYPHLRAAIDISQIPHVECLLKAAVFFGSNENFKGKESKNIKIGEAFNGTNYVFSGTRKSLRK
ncbi:hypothetical protein TVAG_329880 [Trichomonas vaginalis G3]|uniref:AAA+ ATPase domain-containing protein n=1 Tax=Trichomonas vaginalis (strain ATCC PRA-98 / G3) TaxID=412133 RepID=A2FQT4_TRIV3|nr:cornified envelope assembly [Trichomonas vaginalis G3]EAX92727.1 hypothetical protein TVAG_329880 [Trichomonas vaginalis G3]KAI5482350.1 cornified envelope assembly [Trichomonas vaginalis G3]|eukprot:XP_001305657.1 hypothetical protein [Trichomonas vaginalis G3]